MKIGFFLKEALRALRRNAAPSLAAFATILITTLVLGVFIPVVRAATAKTNEVRNKIELEVFIHEDATRAETTELGNRLGAIPHVERTEFVSKEEALQILRGRLGAKSDIVEDLPGNPLPASYRIKLDEPGNVDVVKSAIQPVDAGGQARYISDVIDEVKDREDDTNKILSATSTIKILLAALAALLVAASILLVANTIRLSVFSRRREVEVMRLVGATNWFIRIPFMLEGVFAALMGAVAAGAVILLANTLLFSRIGETLTFLGPVFSFTSTEIVTVMLVLGGTGCAVGLIGSMMALRRFLEV